MSKSSLFVWEQRVDYRFDTIVDQSFENLARDAEQRYDKYKANAIEVEAKEHFRAFFRAVKQAFG